MPASEKHIKLSGAAMAALAALVIALYGFTAGYPFLWDEREFIADNPLVRDLSYFTDLERGADFTQHYSAVKRRYLTYLSFALNYAAHGMAPAGFRVVNIAIHIANSLLVYWLLTMLLALSSGRRRDGGRIAALAGAAIFAAHPLCTEAVTYTFQRGASLAAMFYLASAALYLRRRAFGGGMACYTLALASAVLAMISKENAFTLPIALLMMESFFIKERPFRERALSLIPFALTMLIIPGMFMAPGKPTSIIPAVTNIYGVYGPRDYFITQARVVVTYLRLMMLPVNQVISYSYPLYKSFASPAFVVSASMHMVMLLAGAIGVSRGGRLRLAGAGVLWFYLALSVESSFISIPMLINEYRVYLPLAGAVMALAALVDRMEENPSARRKSAALLAVLVMLLSVLTIARNETWSSRIKLWGDTASKAPSNILAFNNLAIGYKQAGDSAAAIKTYQTAIALDKEPKLHKFMSSEIRYNLGISYALNNQYDKALREFSAALALNPMNAYAYNNLAASYHKLGDTTKALNYYHQALAIENVPVFHMGLAEVYHAKGMDEKALASLNRYLASSPDDAEAIKLLKEIKAGLGASAASD